MERCSSVNPFLKVLSGGVASNLYIRKALSVIAETTGLQLLCPPAKFCTDNGVMIAWFAFCILIFTCIHCFFWLFFSSQRNGVERLREQRGILPPNVDVSYEPKWVSTSTGFNDENQNLLQHTVFRAPLGVDITAEVRAAAIRLPSVKMKISWFC